MPVHSLAARACQLLFLIAGLAIGAAIAVWMVIAGVIWLAVIVLTVRDLLRV